MVFDANSGAAEKLVREVLEGYATVVEDISEILKKVEEMKETKLNGKYIVFSVDDDKLEKVRNIVGIGENSLVKQSITIRDNKSLGLETDGYYIMIDGSEEACEEAQERLKDVAKELEGDEKQKVIDKMKEMEESAMEGFGGIFG